jgi:alkylated DNA repair dioxygenase AlkB
LPFKRFEFHGFLGNRRVVSFGWRYDFAGATLRPSDDIPPFLLSLREWAAAFAGIAAEGLQQILINEYAPGAGIGWHRDKLRRRQDQLRLYVGCGGRNGLASTERARRSNEN